METAGITARTGARQIEKITNVTAFVGASFQPETVDITIAGGPFRISPQSVAATRPKKAT